MVKALRVTLLAAAAAVFAVPQPLGLPAATAAQTGQGEPLCRRAAPLPPLPTEAEPAADERSDGAISVTGGRIARSEHTSSSPVVAVRDEEYTLSGSASPPPPAAAPVARSEAGRVAWLREPGSVAGSAEPESGQLTAGEHDDLLNPELYARYVRRAGGALDIKGIPVLDTRRVFLVSVEDDAGRPVPFADVTLTCADGNRLTLSTVADGTAIFFPALDRLGENVRVEASKDGQRNGGARLVPVEGRGEAQRHRIRLPGGSERPTRFDLFLAVDTTGSMSDELEFLKSELRAIVGDIARRHSNLDIRVGLVAYRDEGDDYVTRTFPFTRRVEDIQQHVRAQRADGGGDLPEAMDEALARAVAQDWRPDAVRALLLVADAPPHDRNMARTWAVAEAARAKRIQIVPIAASGVDDLAEFTMRGMSALTQSRYIFLTDDSGIGNAHAEPAVDCYQVTRLDALVRRVLASLIAGRRVEAPPGEVIRSVGNYRNGRCLLPRGWSADR